MKIIKIIILIVIVAIVSIYKFKERQVFFKGNYKDVKLEEIRKTYYDTGELESERFYINGKFEGIGNYYLKNGDIIKIRN